MEEDNLRTSRRIAAGGDTIATEDNPDDLFMSEQLHNLHVDEAFAHNLDGVQTGHPPSEASLFPRDDNHPTLESLPLELLMHVCSYIDAKFITDSLSQVCQPFQDVLGVDSYWKSRILSRWHQVYPAIPDENFDWRQACIEREEMNKIWSSPYDHYDVLSYYANIFAPVDAVHILKDKNVFVSGSRDRHLNIVDIDKLTRDPDSVKEATLHWSPAHKGWIWTITSLDNQLCTGSWDSYIKLWDIHTGCSQINQFKCKSAVLGLHLEQGLIVAACYDKRLYQIDPRDGNIQERRHHKQPVLCLAVDQDYIITGSEDNTICILDRRAGKILKTIPLECYPMSLSYGDNQLWVGDKSGQVHLFDTRNGDFTEIDSYDIGHRGKVTSIQHTPGALFTCSTDKTIKVSQPSRNPGNIFTVQENGEQAGIHYRNGILVSAGSGIAVQVWKPKVNNSESSTNQDQSDIDQSEDSPESHDQSQSNSLLSLD